MTENEKKFQLSDHIEDEMIGQVLDESTAVKKVNFDNLTKAYSAAKEAELNDKKFESDKLLRQEELKEKARENDLKEQELKDNKKSKIWDIGSKVVLSIVTIGAAVFLQKQDQSFQKDGFGYDNETSNRSKDMMNKLKIF